MLKVLVNFFKLSNTSLHTAENINLQNTSPKACPRCHTASSPSGQAQSPLTHHFYTQSCFCSTWLNVSLLDGALSLPQNKFNIKLFSPKLPVSTICLSPTQQSRCRPSDLKQTLYNHSCVHQRPGAKVKIQT